MKTFRAGFSAASAIAIALFVGACQPAPVIGPTPSQTSEVVIDEGDGFLHLDPAKEHGDRYADDILPVGDEKWSTTTPAVGTVFLCADTFVPDAQAGPQTRGPWFTSGNAEWDSGAKTSIAGEVFWDHEFSHVVTGGDRVIETNDLPEHHTGVFPVAASDPARVYDGNPNSISAQSLTYSLSAAPVPGEPQCMGNEVGVMLTGVALYNAFDAGGRDAGAWEVQDTCDGHPQAAGEYHYHSLSRCITDVDVSTVIGFALDGFPITGPRVGEANVLTTIDLDECHGIVSEIELDGDLVEMYHYVMTEDFPYSASCFRGTASAAPAGAGGAPVAGGPPPPPSGNAP